MSGKIAMKKKCDIKSLSKSIKNKWTNNHYLD